MSNYKNKYFKYKSKYLQLKNIHEGGRVDCRKVYKNVIGTCWAVAILTIFTFCQATSNQLETIMKSYKPLSISWYNPFINITDSKNKFIAEIINKVKSDPQLYNLFPDYIFTFPNSLFLINILDKIIDRYYSKILEFNYTEKPLGTMDKQNPIRCELVIAQNFKNLFPSLLKTDNNNYGSKIHHQYLFSNLLTIFFLGFKVSFKNYYNNFNSLIFDIDNDLGILIYIEGHICCLYICNGVEKYYNDNDKKVYDCEWIKLLKESTSDLYVELGQKLRLINVDSYEYKKNLKKVICLTVISKHVKDSSLDIEIKKILKFTDFEPIDFKDIILQMMLFQYYYFDKNNYIKASEFARLAADQGNAVAQTNLGIMYYKGQGVQQDYEEAARLYRLAVDQGYAAAQTNLGIMYYNGLGVQQDYYEAVRLYRLAVDQGNAVAQTELGFMYYNGLVVQQDYEEAARLYSLAAYQGNATAQTNLGGMYFIGQGVPQNYNEAKSLFTLAEKQGNVIAKDNLEKLKFE